MNKGKIMKDQHLKMKQTSDSAGNWGRVLIATRLEKMVENQFVVDWSHLITMGKRPGDAMVLIKDRVAHQAANEAARALLRSPQDSILYIDSDAAFGYDLLEQLRELPEGKDYDALQAFYTRRGWPPEAIWFKENPLGDIQQMVLFEGADNTTSEVAYVGLHFVLIRRTVFEAMLAANPDIPPTEFEFFTYPRHKKMSEDAAFSLDARALGFKFGATTKVKTGHIGRLTTGWETYHQSMELSGANEHWEH
jgi:hypothetical protein